MEEPNDLLPFYMKKKKEAERNRFLALAILTVIGIIITVAANAQTSVPDPLIYVVDSDKDGRLDTTVTRSQYEQVKATGTGATTVGNCQAFNYGGYVYYFTICPQVQEETPARKEEE